MATLDKTQTFVEFYYRIMYPEFTGLDSLYEDYIIRLIGQVGLNILHDNGYLESCGVVNGRKLYTLDKRGLRYE